MKTAILWCFSLILLCELKTFGLELYRCYTNDLKNLKFYCGQNSTKLGDFYQHYKSSSNELPEKYRCSSDSISLVLPQDIFNGIGKFSSPNQLDITSLKIRKLEAAESSLNASTITTFNASDNKLHQIPTTIIMPSLTTIDLSFNRFVKLASNAFVGSTKLVRIYFSNNRISSVEFTVFTKFENLEYLNLENNQITAIDWDIKHNKKLKYFLLRSNPLKIYDTKLSSMLPTSYGLFLPINSIEVLNACCKTTKNVNVIDFYLLWLSSGSLKNLVRLNISNIQLTDLSSLSKAPRLQELDMSANRITDLKNDSFIGATQLKSINLSHNKISNIEIGAFTQVKQLKKLDLAYNYIEKINENTFQNQKKLVELDLSENRLKNVDEIFGPSNFGELTGLNLNGNNLTSIDDITPQKFPKLWNFSFSRNCFQSGYLEMYLKQWNKRLLQMDMNTKTGGNIENDLNNGNTMAYAIIGAVIVIVCLCIAFLVYWYFYREEPFVEQNKAAESEYVEPSYDYFRASDASIYENVNQMNRNIHDRFGEVEEDEQLYEDMYVTAAEIELNCLKENAQNGPNTPYDHLEFSNN